MVQNFQTFFENFAFINMSSLIINKTKFSKTDISYLLKRTRTCIFQGARHFIFTVDWFTLIKTKLIGVA